MYNTKSFIKIIVFGMFVFSCGGSDVESEVSPDISSENVANNNVNKKN